MKTLALVECDVQPVLLQVVEAASCRRRHETKHSLKTHYLNSKISTFSTVTFNRDHDRDSCDRGSCVLAVSLMLAIHLPFIFERINIPSMM